MIAPRKCLWCKEAMTDSDEMLRAVPGHRECSFRAVLGSVGHIRGRCSCVGGTEEDPIGLSPRDAARMAVIEAIEKGLFQPEGFGWTDQVKASLRPTIYGSLPKKERTRIDGILGLPILGPPN